MNKMTKQQAIENHRKMWNWIADETLRQEMKVEKWEYFRTMGVQPSMRPLNECYCCEYAKRECGICPVVWPKSYTGEELYCTYLYSLYNLWYQAISYEKAAKLARDIANLPERK